MTEQPQRPPWMSRLLSALIHGRDAEALRGDLEEAWHRRLAEEGDSLRVRSWAVRDAAASLLAWWWAWPSRRASAPRPHKREGKMATFGPEVRQMIRGLLRRPAYSGLVILTLGLGIGATAAIYSVVDAMLIRPLPYRDAERLVVIGNTTPGREWREGREGLQQLEALALPSFQDLRSRVRGIEASAAIERRGWLSASPELPAQILEVANVEEGFFDLLSVRPLLGRLPRDGDQAADGGQWGATITHDGWQRRFGGDAEVIGKRFGPFQIIGVLPRDFVQPAALVGADVEFWAHLDPTDRRYTDRRRRGVSVLARLEASASVDGLRRDLSLAQTRLATELPESHVLPDGRSLGVGVNTLRDATIGNGQRPVLIFLGAAVLLLVLACTNAANLLVVRGLERERELSLRRALGALRARLAACLVIESVALALAGGIAGLGIAVAGIAAFRRYGPESLPRMGEVAVNFRIVAAGMLASLVVGAVVGLVPAIRSSRADILANLRSSLTAVTSGGTRLRTSLAATQLALALILGISAILLFRSFVFLRTERLGFEPDRLVAFTVAFKAERPWENWDQVLGALRALPGADAVAGASSLPFQSPGLQLRFVPADQAQDAPTAPVPAYSISPGFFETARIRLLQGRSFDVTDQPESRSVAIVNGRFAHSTFGARNPIGQILTVRDEGFLREFLIVGVADDVIQARVEDGLLPAVYLPHTQMPAPLTVLMSTRRSATELEREIRRAIVGVGLRAAPVLGLSSMETRIAKTLVTPRFQLLLIAGFAGAAVLLAAIGLYGTLTFTVWSRTRELGIRMAMGASPQQVFRLVLRQGVAVLGIGLTAGVIGALGLTRFLQGVLYRVSPVDPVAFLAAVLLVVAAVVVATLRPAGRASRVDPMISIRAET